MGIFFGELCLILLSKIIGYENSTKSFVYGYFIINYK